jgi:hypothetical protein
MSPRALALAVSAALVLSSCAAYKAQHAGGTASVKPRTEAAPRAAKSDDAFAKSFEIETDGPVDQRLASLISEVDKYQAELRAEGKYDCCVKPACKQCALTAGECHCREVIAANGPCCGECTQAWVEGRGDAPGVDREKVLEHLGCVRELYEKKVPEGMTAPGQRKDGADEHQHHH